MKCWGQGFFWSLNSSSCPSEIAVSADVTFAMRLQVIWGAGTRLQFTFCVSSCQDTLARSRYFGGK